MITMIPRNWKEVKAFKGHLRENKVPKKEIWRRTKPGIYDENEYFYVYDGEYQTEKRAFAIHWISSSTKKKIDEKSREDRLQRAERKLIELRNKLNKRKLKELTAIEEAASDILKSNNVDRFIKINVGETREIERVQKSKGRPGKSTEYEERVSVLYTLEWHRDKDVLQAEKRVDGCLPLLSTDKSLTALEVLQGYKYQPRLEKRFTQFKSIHKAAPMFFKRIERVEANLFVFFIALMAQALIEREVRDTMLERNIGSLDIYPEEREYKHPTAHSILSAFENISRYEIMNDGEII